MTNDEMAEMIAERNGNQRFCKNCDDCCQPYNSTDDCFKSAMEAMDWKDEQFAKEKESFFKEYRKEILDACIYDFEQKKQQLFDKAMKVICDGCAQRVACEFHNWKTCCTKEELIKAMEE